MCLEELGAESAQSFPGQELMPLQKQTAPARQEPPPAATTQCTGDATPIALGPSTPTQPVKRVIQALDDGRHGTGYRFGIFKPTAGEALTAPWASCTTAHAVDVLARVEAWSPPAGERVYVILDQLSAHRATDVLLVSPAPPRWKFSFQPKSAPYLNRIAPWWKVWRSRALKGRRFETWVDVCQAVQEATAYRNAQQYPCMWGRRRRHQSRRRPGIRLLPKVA